MEKPSTFLWPASGLERKLQNVPSLLDKAGFFIYYLAVCWLFVVFTVFVLLLLAGPLLIQSENQILLGLGALAYNIVSVFSMCHQLPMRSFFIQGVQQAVCARDVGIYLGVIAGGLFFHHKNVGFFRTKRFFLLTLIPIGLDGVTQTVFQMRESSNLLRLATGLLFGFGLMLFVLYRIRKLNVPEFKEVTSRDYFKAALTVLMFFTLLLALALGSEAGGPYVSKTAATEAAFNPTPDGLDVFYIPPRTPLSLYAYPRRGDYNDRVVDDLAGMKWIEDTINLFMNDSLLNQSSLWDFSMPTGHLRGIWAVVHTQGGCGFSEGAVFCNTPGEYRYVDASTGLVFENRSH